MYTYNTNKDSNITQMLQNICPYLGVAITSSSCVKWTPTRNSTLNLINTFVNQVECNQNELQSSNSLIIWVINTYSV